ncbi:hypothetical protein EVAR_16117_1 [Eumeta japonica]|uniref:Uncharacterized protein n=1 Tax=Eumeta variegata TaxID=151549 RepID=A0A4C1UIG0_EUMVA|nr:hypothetical protein EVAR_16117_1 [Eumeta japonica]
MTIPYFIKFFPIISEEYTDKCADRQGQEDVCTFGGGGVTGRGPRAKQAPPSFRNFREQKSASPEASAEPILHF